MKQSDEKALNDDNPMLNASSDGAISWVASAYAALYNTARESVSSFYTWAMRSLFTSNDEIGQENNEILIPSASARALVAQSSAANDNAVQVLQVRPSATARDLVERNRTLMDEANHFNVDPVPPSTNARRIVAVANTAAREALAQQQRVDRTANKLHATEPGPDSDPNPLQGSLHDEEFGAKNKFPK